MSASAHLHCNSNGTEMEVKIRDLSRDDIPNTIALNIYSNDPGGSQSYFTIFVNHGQLEIIAEEIGDFLDKMQRDKLEEAAIATDKAFAVLGIV